MKAWKTIAIAAFAVIAVALTATAAFAYMGGQGAYNPYGSYGPAPASGGSMMGGHMGGSMMGGTNSPYQGYPQQNQYMWQYNRSAYGHNGCPTHSWNATQP